jgi:hypothetical protein
VFVCMCVRVCIRVCVYICVDEGAAWLGVRRHAFEPKRLTLVWQEIDCVWDLHNLRECLKRCKKAVKLVSESGVADAFGRAARAAARDSARGAPSVLHFAGHGDPGVLYLETRDSCAVAVKVRRCIGSVSHFRAHMHHQITCVNALFWGFEPACVCVHDVRAKKQTCSRETRSDLHAAMALGPTRRAKTSTTYWALRARRSCFWQRACPRRSALRWPALACLTWLQRRSRSLRMSL